MTAREFLQIVKRHAVDGVAESLVSGPKRLAAIPLSTERPPEQPTSVTDAWMDKQITSARETLKWLGQLSENDRNQIRALLQEGSEISVASFLNVLDGTGGDFEGVFEVFAVTDDGRTLVNPQNRDMLHDLFSEACQEGRNNE